MISQITTQVNSPEKILLLRLKNTSEESVSQLKSTNVSLVLKLNNKKFNTDNNLEEVVSSVERRAQNILDVTSNPEYVTRSTANNNVSEEVVQLNEYISIGIRNAIREDNIENFSSIVSPGHPRVIIPLQNNFESIATQNVFPINYETFLPVTSHRSFSHLLSDALSNFGRESLEGILSVLNTDISTYNTLSILILIILPIMIAIPTFDFSLLNRSFYSWGREINSILHRSITIALTRSQVPVTVLRENIRDLASNTIVTVVNTTSNIREQLSRPFSFTREIGRYFWSLRGLLPLIPMIPLLPRLVGNLVNRPEIRLPEGVLTSLVDRLRDLSRERPRNVFSIEDIFRYIRDHLN
jgi:hypothetical protein